MLAEDRVSTQAFVQQHPPSQRIRYFPDECLSKHAVKCHGKFAMNVNYMNASRFDPC